MAWRPELPHAQSASTASTSTSQPRKRGRRWLWLLIVLLLALLTSRLHDTPGEGETETAAIQSLATIENIDASIREGEVRVAFDLVLTPAATTVETIGYRLDDGLLTKRELPAATVTFAPGEVRKSLHLSFTAKTTTALALVLHDSSAGITIGGEGRYPIKVAQIAPASAKPRQSKPVRPRRAVTAPPAAIVTAPETVTADTQLTPLAPPADAEVTPEPVAKPETLNDERWVDLAFVKLDANGKPLADQSADYATTQWSCVLDRSTGLVWEIKSDDEGLHDKDWTYTWYAPHAGNGGNAGTARKGFCGDTLAAGCDTGKFADAVNSSGLCGANDWRLPTQQELQSIAALDRVDPSVDRALFPNTKPSWYWTSTPVASDAQHAWIIGFYHGYDVWGRKSHDFYARLVRGVTPYSPKLSRSSDQ